MTPQLLIIKIQSLTSGTAKFELGQLKLLASEYQKLHEQCAKRLEQCTSLIKTNRDYLALELVESEPPLLDTISAISFEELPKWDKLCKEYGIDTCPPFDDFQIDLLQSLYTKDIGQTHPLYRDYRRAMRMHNYKNALKVIGTISRINSQDYEIRQEYLRLLNSEIEKAFKKLKEALKNKNKDEILKFYAFLETHKNDFNQEEKDWESISDSVKLIKKDDALKNKTEILKEISELDAEKQWALVLEKIQELKFIEAEYDLKSDESQTELIAQKQSIVDERKKASDLAKLKLITTEETKNALANENKKSTARARLNAYKKFDEKSDLLDKETAKKLNARMGTLRNVMLIKLSFQALCLACIAGAGTYGALYVKNEIQAKERLHQASIRLAQISSNASIDNIKAALDLYKKDYAEFLDTNELTLTQIATKIEQQEEYKSIADSILAKLNSALTEGASLEKTAEINANITSLEDTIKLMLRDDINLYQLKLDSFKTKYNTNLTAIEAEYNAKLKDYLSKTESLIKNIDFDLSTETMQDLAKSREYLDATKKLIEDNSKFFTLHNMDKIKLDDLSLSQLEFEAKINDFLDIKKLLADTLNVDEYFTTLEKLQREVELSNTLKGALASVLSKKQELKYGKGVENFSDEEINNANNISKLSLLESLPSALLELSEVYVYDNGVSTAYTQGALKETKNTWTGGYEIVQRGKEFTPRGTTVFITKNKLSQGNRISKDEIYTNERLSKEAQFINSLHEEKHSLLKLINLIYESDTDPLFKLWFEGEIFNLAMANNTESGLLYSPTAQARAEQVAKHKIGISSLSWLRNDPIKKKEINYSLYSGKLIDLENDAMQKLESTKAVINSKVNLVGFADENGELNIDLKDYAKAKIYAIDRQGKEILLVEDGILLTKAMPFSPLVLRD